MSDNIFEKAPDIGYVEEALEVNSSEFEKVVDSRRSIRVYTDEKISDEIVHKCIDIALKAPNSSNLQPWEFYRIKNPKVKESIARHCMNQPAAKTAAELIVCVAKTKTWKKHAAQILEAFEKDDVPTPKSAILYYKKLVPFVYGQGFLGLWGLVKKIIIFFAGIKKVTPRGPTSKADMRVWAHKSTALACENLMLAFSAYGYDSCPMEGLDEKRVKKELGLKGDSEVCMIISAGKRDPSKVYGPRLRLPREQFVFEV